MVHLLIILKQIRLIKNRILRLFSLWKKCRFSIKIYFLTNIDIYQKSKYIGWKYRTCTCNFCKNCLKKSCTSQKLWPFEKGHIFQCFDHSALYLIYLGNFFFLQIVCISDIIFNFYNKNILCWIASYRIRTVL